MTTLQAEPSPPGTASAVRRPNKPRPRTYLLPLILPAVLVLAAITLYPFFWLVYMSLHEVVLAPGRPSLFVGLENFKNIFTDPQYWHGWGLLARYTVLCMVLQVGLGTLLAVLLNRAKWEKGLVTVFLLPMMVAPIVVGLLHQFLFNGTFGWYFWFLRSLGLLQNETILGDPSLALYAIVATDVWEWTPLVALIVLAGLKRVPQDQLEASWVDGAGPVRSFFQVVLPNIKSVLLIAVLLRFMDNVRLIDTFLALTGGGPANSTKVLPVYLYERSFSFFELGVGAAIALTLLLVTIIFGKVAVRVFEEADKQNMRAGEIS